VDQELARSGVQSSASNQHTCLTGGVCVEVFGRTAKTELSAPKRRTRAEVQQLVAEFMSSGVRRSEFCQSRSLSFSTLDRHLKKLRWKKRRKPISSAGRLVPVELAARKSTKQHERSCGLAVVLPGGRRIEVDPDFDRSTFERLVEKGASLGRNRAMRRAMSS
jgi:hypothetical protein